MLFDLLECTHELVSDDGLGLVTTSHRECSVCLDLMIWGAPVAVAMNCPACGKAHVDEGVWAVRSHREHRCVDDAAGFGCGHAWRMDQTVRGVLCGPCGHPHATYGCTEPTRDAAGVCRAPIDEIARRWTGDHEGLTLALQTAAR